MSLLVGRPRYRVRLRGTWERSNTHGSDIRLLRRELARVLVAELLGSVTFVVRRSHSYHRHGTFEASLKVRARNERRAITVAAQQLRNLVSDLACRPPQISVDRSRSEAERLAIP